MSQCYLFVHFKERSTPDGEQVYFSISKDGMHWEPVKGGDPVLWTYYGTRGARDMTIVRHPQTGRVYVVATDLSIAYGVRRHRSDFWEYVGTHGSSSLSVWESEDLVHWTEQRLEEMALFNGVFGCVWAPDAIWDPEKEQFLLHWSSSVSDDDFKRKRIFASYTADFHSFSEPFVLYEEDQDVIDSAMYRFEDKYYLFYKGGVPTRVRLAVSDHITGPFEPMEAFDQSMEAVELGKYEAPTAIQLEDGRWALFIDYYGAYGADQGYVPFLSDDLSSGVFTQASDDFSFPYHFKHGTILKITEEEFERLQSFDWTDPGFVEFF
ncbi:MAG: glycoside hydrolase family 43 protein [Clostridiales bacterium]|nr:glycoside hydrolase family 43 protein [Clostridiales bacterium]